MRTLLLFLSLIILTGCKDTPSVNTPPETPAEAPKEASVERLKEDHVAADFANFLAPLIDPEKLDTLKGKRAATPRLRKACYWLQMAHTSGFDAGEIIDQAHAEGDRFKVKPLPIQASGIRIRHALIPNHFSGLELPLFGVASNIEWRYLAAL